MIADSNVTIVVVPRERFNYTQQSLESIYQNTDYPYRLVYVDVNSPASIRNYLEKQSQEKNFKLIRINHFLAPNQARNIALQHVETEYVVFIDNDVLVRPGWLNALVNCANETGAWIVAPLCLEGDDFAKVHMAGGSYQFKPRGEHRWMTMRRPYFRTPLSKVRGEFQRQPTEAVEFHCVLVRSSVFRELGPLDEKVMSVGQEDDLCLTVLAAEKPIYFEPASIISYVLPSNLTWADLLFFYKRWSKALCDASIEHLCEKWNLSSDAPVVKNFRRFTHSHSYYPEPHAQGGVYYIAYFLQRSTMRLLRKFVNWQARVSLAKES